MAMKAAHCAATEATRGNGTQRRQKGGMPGAGCSVVSKARVPGGAGGRATTGPSEFIRVGDPGKQRKGSAAGPGTAATGATSARLPSDHSPAGWATGALSPATAGWGAVTAVAATPDLAAGTGRVLVLRCDLLILTRRPVILLLGACWCQTGFRSSWLALLPLSWWRLDAHSSLHPHEEETASHKDGRQPPSTYGPVQENAAGSGGPSGKRPSPQKKLGTRKPQNGKLGCPRPAERVFKVADREGRRFWASRTQCQLATECPPAGLEYPGTDSSTPRGHLPRAAGACAPSVMGALQCFSSGTSPDTSQGDSGTNTRLPDACSLHRVKCCGVRGAQQPPDDTTGPG
ncbi:hypothetical protein P7K49_039143 [Saguinus oedipus]|uniref:Uncharacterized protein n=1 Tax=Saguinus oedipus TaxID=9490 RepID=A0ABQ9TGN5_SAGOE|nr:hypothetical protein P7K49_039143 [Saguinus oedipus]